MSVADKRMAGRVCLITGATSGIGRVTARALAERGATVVLVGRDPIRAQETTAQIRQQTGNAQVDYLLADLSAQAQVRQLAEQFSKRYSQLHVLVNNAGSMFLSRRESADGLEKTLALNYLAPFLLTNLLRDALKASVPARIINVTSLEHMGKQIPFDDLQTTHRRYQPLQVYGQSKLAIVLFTYELARRLAGTGVTANALHPGVVASNFGRADNLLMRIGMPLMRPFFLTPEAGAETMIYLATAPEVAEVSGKYFVRRRPVSSSPASYDQEAARRLWEASAQLTGLAATL